jgi:hypothetical protein
MRIDRLAFAGSRLTVRGGMSPFQEGMAVNVDLLRKRSWGWALMVRKTKTLDEAGNFAAGFPSPSKPGTYKIRARFNGDSEYAGSMVKKVLKLS